MNAGRRQSRIVVAAVAAAALGVLLALTLGLGLVAPGGPTPATAGSNQADMSIKKSATPNPAVLGRKLTYEVLVTNNGPGTATNVIGADRLPPEVKFESATASKGGKCFVTSVVQCPIGTMGSGETQKMTIVTTVAEKPFEGDSITNRCSVFSDNDPNPDNDHCEVSTKVIEKGPCIPEAAFTDLEIMKTIVRNLKQKEDGDLTSKKVDERTKRVERIKRNSLLPAFPEIFGEAFPIVYFDIEDIDFQMSDARQGFGSKHHDIKDDFKDALASIANLQRTGSPLAARSDLDKMQDIVRELKRQGDNLTEKRLKKRTKRVEGIKRDMLEEHYGEVCGVAFIDVFLRLENIDAKMLDAQLRLNGHKHRRMKIRKLRRDLEAALKSIKALQRLLE